MRYTFLCLPRADFIRKETEIKMTERNFTSGPILPAMLRFALPTLAAMLLQAAYGAADLIIVGNFGDAASVSAVGSGSEVMMLVTCILTGLTMGATVLLGQRIGEGRPKEAGSVVGASIALFLLVALVLTAAMELLTVPLCRLMQTPEEAFDKTVTYVRICSAGVLFITGYNVISGIFRGIGNSALPMRFVAIAAVCNVLLDLLLCGVFHMDAAGAAIATIFSQGISVVLSLFIIRRQKLPFRVEKASVSLRNPDCRSILLLGLPIAFQDALVHFSFIAVNSFANGMGLLASAGYGIGNRLIGFIFLVPSAVGASVTAFVSQNVGAAKYGRARAGLFRAMLTGLCFGILLTLLGFFGGGFLSSFFSDDPAVIQKSAEYLRGFSPDCILTCMLFAFSGFYNGHGRTVWTMLQGIGSALLIRFPVSWLFSTLPNANLFLLGLATPITTAVGILFYLFCYLRMKRKMPERLHD